MRLTNHTPSREPSAVGRPPGVALNFRVPPEFKRQFKIAAAVGGITQSALLRRIFEHWRARDGAA